MNAEFLQAVSIKPRIHARTATIVSALLFACAVQAAAQSPPAPQSTTVVRNAPSMRGEPPCMEDMKRFCGGGLPGEGRTFACLRSHISQLTPACRERQTRRRKKPPLLESLLGHFFDFLAMGDGMQSVLRNFFALVALASTVGRTVVYAVSRRMRKGSLRSTGVFTVFIRTLFVMTVICLILNFVCDALLINAISGPIGW